MSTAAAPTFTPDWIAAQLRDLISESPDYVRHGASRLLDSLTAGVATAAASRVESDDDEEHSEAEDEPL
jgi:hypothetical protein